MGQAITMISPYQMISAEANVVEGTQEKRRTSNSFVYSKPNPLPINSLKPKMTSLSNIINKAKFLVVSIITLLLIGHGQSGARGPEAGYGQNANTKQMKRAKLLKNNLEVESEILDVFSECTSRLIGIFDTIQNVEGESNNKETEINSDELNNNNNLKALTSVTPFNSKISPDRMNIKEEPKVKYLDHVMAKIMSNLRSEILVVLELIQRSSLLKEMFNKPHLIALRDFPTELRKMPSELFATRSPFEVTMHLALRTMDLSMQRRKWREEVKRIIEKDDDNSLPDVLKDLNGHRVLYDSVYARLAVMKATLETGKIAYENQQAAIAGEKEQGVASSVVFAQQRDKVKDFDHTIKQMVQFIQDGKKLLARVEVVLNNGERLTQEEEQMARHRGHNFASIGLPGKADIKALAKGDEPAFGLLMGKSEREAKLFGRKCWKAGKGCKWTQDAVFWYQYGAEMAIKYELVQDVAALFKLSIRMERSKDGRIGKFWRKMLAKRNDKFS